jgi:hypothetical protein
MPHRRLDTHSASPIDPGFSPHLSKCRTVARLLCDASPRPLNQDLAMTRAFAPLAAALALLAVAAPASAEPFALFVYETPSDFAARNDPTRAQAYWGGFAALSEQMAAAGIVRGGGPLAEPALGATVSVRDARATSAPVDGTGEALSGWFVIDVADRAEAEAWAARVPAASTARIEVRPILDIPMAGGMAR